MLKCHKGILLGRIPHRANPMLFCQNDIMLFYGRMILGCFLPDDGWYRLASEFSMGFQLKVDMVFQVIVLHVWYCSSEFCYIWCFN